jgi:AbrB family looped-hinge helix DNA binding protein
MAVSWYYEIVKLKNMEVKYMPLVKVKRYCQITLPSIIRKKFRIDEGDYLEIEEKDGSMVLRPVKLVHPDQAYFYTEEWQKGEAKADKEIAKGDVLGPFKDLKKGLKALKTAKV